MAGVSAGDQVEGITGPQHHRHPAEQAELALPLTAPDHQNSDGDDRDQIDDIKQGFRNCLHRVSSFISRMLIKSPADNLQYGGGIIVLPQQGGQHQGK